MTKWVNRKTAEVNFHLTQFITDHVGYRAYLHRFGHDICPNCPECKDEVKNVEYVFFKCPRFRSVMTKIESKIGEQLCPENVIDIMTKSEENWNEICGGIVKVQNELRRLEAQR